MLPTPLARFCMIAACALPWLASGASAEPAAGAGVMQDARQLVQAGNENVQDKMPGDALEIMLFVHRPDLTVRAPAR